MSTDGHHRSSQPAGPLVSLIMPAWRPRADWLREAVAAALAQRECAIELLVVDDGNPSPVADALSDVADPRLRIIRIPHGGVSRARNAGMAQARGAFMRFIDCDDVIDPDSTHRLLALSSDERTIAYGATAYCYAELTPYRTVVCSLQGSIVPEGLTAFTVTLPALLFPRRVIELTGEWDEAITICEDWDFVQRALEHGRVHGDAIVAVKYRRYATSTVGTASADAAERGAHRVVEKYLARHPDERRSAHVRRADAVRLTTAGDGYLRSGARIAALGRFVAALRADPAYAVPAVSRIVEREVRMRIARMRTARMPGRGSRPPRVSP